MFHIIDMDTWPRRDHFRYYTEEIRTSYQVSYDLDVTQMRSICREKNLHFYPVMIYAIMNAINRHEAFRMAVDKEGRLGYYDVCHPSYTIFHKDDCTFSDIWTTYDEDFRKFYQAATADMENCRDVKGVQGKPGRPDAFTPISCVPWLHFSSVGHDTPGPRQMYFPLITFGKYEEKDGKWTLPLSVFINHAAADGYHTSMLILDIERNCAECGTWMK